MINANRMSYDINGEQVNAELRDLQPQIIAETMEAIWRNDPDAVVLEFIKQADGKRIWQVKDKRRIMLQYKEI